MVTGNQILAGVAMLVGFGMVSTLIKPFYFILRSKTWNVAPGKILHSEIEVTPEFVSATPRIAFWVPRIRYTYIVDGDRYQGDRVNFTGHGDWAAQRLPRKYPPGTEVMVWYDPENPANSVLDRRLTSISVLFAVLAASWLIVSVVVFTGTLWPHDAA